MHFVALTSVPERELLRETMTRRAQRALERLEPGVPVERIEQVSSSVLHVGAHERLAGDPGGAWLLSCEPSVVAEGIAERLDAGKLLSRFVSEGPDFAGQVCPPLGVLFGASGGDPVACVDRQALHHLYRWQGDGVAVVATSPLVIAAIARLTLDFTALGEFAWVGNFLGTRTLVDGVEKLAAGERVSLESGRLRTHLPISDDAAVLEEVRATPESGASIVSRFVCRTLDLYPGVVIELSGGLDSRIVLAAVPPERRRGLRCLTIGTRESADVVIAKKIAKRWQLQHEWLDLAPIGALDVAEAWQHLRSASRRHMYMANPFEKGVLEYVRTKVEPEARLVGMNGEFARGFYYPGQRVAADRSDAMLARLIDWRLTTNNAVRGSLFEGDFLERGRASVSDSVHAAFERYPKQWAAALDEFYLDSRMQRWAGITCSASAGERPILAPFFDRAFLSWSRSLSATRKQDSRIMSEMLGVLDAELFALPLDTGWSPESRVRRGAVARLKRGAQTGSKMIAKVAQRISRRGRPGIGAGTFRELAVRDSRRLREELTGIDRVSVVRSSELDRVAEECANDSSTLGLLLDIAWAVDEIEWLGREIH